MIVPCVMMPGPVAVSGAVRLHRPVRPRSRARKPDTKARTTIAFVCGKILPEVPHCLTNGEAWRTSNPARSRTVHPNQTCLGSPWPIPSRRETAPDPTSPQCEPLQIAGVRLRRREQQRHESPSAAGTKKPREREPTGHRQKRALDRAVNTERGILPPSSAAVSRGDSFVRRNIRPVDVALRAHPCF